MFRKLIILLSYLMHLQLCFLQRVTEYSRIWSTSDASANKPYKSPELIGEMFIHLQKFIKNLQHGCKNDLQMIIIIQAK